jgi:fucose 4-O-acetylase-like acetyltransferase
VLGKRRQQWERVRIAAYLFAVAFAVASGLAAAYMVFAAFFPYENLSEEELAKDDWLALAAVVLFALACATAVLIASGQRAWALVTYVGHAVVGGAALLFALRELSDSSDHELIVFAALVSFTGFVAVVLSLGVPREPRRG